jgi:hypothetical protein
LEVKLSGFKVPTPNPQPQPQSPPLQLHSGLQIRHPKKPTLPTNSPSPKELILTPRMQAKSRDRDEGSAAIGGLEGGQEEEGKGAGEGGRERGERRVVKEEEREEDALVAAMISALKGYKAIILLLLPPSRPNPKPQTLNPKP